MSVPPPAQEQAAPPAQPATDRPRPRRRVVLIGVALIVLVLIGIGEVLARAAFYYEGTVRRAVRAEIHDDWEVGDPSGRDLWYMRPGFKYTLADVIDSKQRSGKVLSVRELEAQSAGRAADEVYLRINSDGFRGPELDPAHPGLRILMLGDSVTMGIVAGEDIPYPHVVDERFRALGLEAEIVNGGVEGYGIEQLVMRLPDYQRIEPDLVTVLIGFNDLVAERVSGGALDAVERYSYMVRGIRRLGVLIDQVRLGRDEVQLRQVRGQLFYEADHPDLRRAERWEPSTLDEWARLVDGFEAGGTTVVVMTMPALFTSEEVPSQAALEMGFRMRWTENAYAIARMTERYNEALRAFAAERGLPLIDLDTWSRGVFQPRDRYFFDGIHMTEEGLRLAGEYVAEQLRPLVEERAARTDPGGRSR